MSRFAARFARIFLTTLIISVLSYSYIVSQIVCGGSKVPFARPCETFFDTLETFFFQNLSKCFLTCIAKCLKTCKNIWFLDKAGGGYWKSQESPDVINGRSPSYNHDNRRDSIVTIQLNVRSFIKIRRLKKVRLMLKNLNISPVFGEMVGWLPPGKVSLLWLYW